MRGAQVVKVDTNQVTGIERRVIVIGRDRAFSRIVTDFYLADQIIYLYKSIFSGGRGVLLAQNATILALSSLIKPQLNLEFDTAFLSQLAPYSFFFSVSILQLFFEIRLNTKFLELFAILFSQGLLAKLT